TQAIDFSDLGGRKVQTSSPINFSDLGEKVVSSRDEGKATLASLLQGFQPNDAGKLAANSVDRPQPPRALTKTKAPGAGPFTEPGAYERWAGEQISPTDSLKETGEAALETAGGVVGAPAATEYGPGIASALAPLAKKYGLRALEGLSAGAGWEIYQALKKHFQ